MKVIWGIPVKPDTTYRASFYAKASTIQGPLTASIESNDGKTVFANAHVSQISPEWKKYTATLKTGKVPASTTNRFVISTGTPGTCGSASSRCSRQPTRTAKTATASTSWSFSRDETAFLRFPGGNYLEGPNSENRFNWKETIGPIEQRPTHMSPWRYRSSDGMGLLEFLNG